jgi:hypothetical protein
MIVNIFLVNSILHAEFISLPVRQTVLTYLRDESKQKYPLDALYFVDRPGRSSYTSWAKRKFIGVAMNKYKDIT